MIKCEICNKEAVHFWLYLSVPFARCDACNIFIDPEKTQNFHEFKKLTKSEYEVALVLKS